MSLPLLLSALVACRPCPVDPPGPGEVRARALTCEAELPTGRFAAARVGDLVLENAVSRFVIRTGTEGRALVGLQGGGLVDAVRLEDGVQVGDDALREVAVTSGFWVLTPDAVEVVSDGSDGEAIVEVRGTWRDLPIVHEVLPIPEPDEPLVHRWILRPDEPILELHTASPSGAPVRVTDLYLWSGDVRPWIPGVGAFDLPASGTVPILGFEPLEGVPAAAVGADEPPTLINVGPILGLGVSGDGTARRRLVLGRDLAAAMAPLWDTEPVEADLPEVGPGTSYELRDPDGAPLTRCDPDADGRIRCAGPPGAVGIGVFKDDGTGDWGGPGQEGVPVTVRIDGIPADRPVRLTATRDGEAPRHLVGVGGDGFLLPAGSWDLAVTTGPDGPVSRGTIAAGPGETVTIEAVVAPPVAPEWIRADFHVHTEASPDSAVRLARRLREARAEGLDVVVLTEHDNVADRAGVPVPPGLTVISGVEVTTMSLGHVNVWPVSLDPDRAGGGAVDWRGLTLTGLWEALPADAIVQCNHPRFVDGGYAALFDLLDLGPGTDLDRIRCDAVEVFNGVAHDETEQVVADWMLLLDRGLRPTATGTSDTHTTADPAGHPRTLLRIDGPPTVASVAEAIRAGRAIVTGGPVVTVRLVDAGGRTADIGDTLDAGGPVTAEVRLRAPADMPLGTVRLFADGEVFATWDVAALEPAADGRIDAVEAFDVPGGASWVVAFHTGGTPQAPRTRRPPMAITNPVWIAR